MPDPALLPPEGLDPSPTPRDMVESLGIALGLVAALFGAVALVMRAPLFS